MQKLQSDSPEKKEGCERGPLINREGKHNQTSLRHQVLGCVWSLATVIGVVLGTACAQALGGTIPPFELNMWRYAAQVALAVPTFAVKHSNLYLIPEKRHVFWIGLVSVSSSAYNIFFYTATTFLPAGTVGGLEPSFVLMLIAGVAIVRFRVCNLHTILAIVACVVGVILLIQPHVIFRGVLPSAAFYNPICTLSNDNSNTSFKPTNDTYHTVQNHNFSSSFNASAAVAENARQIQEAKGYMLIVSSAVSIAIGYVVTTEKLHDCDSLLLVIWIGMIGTGLSAIFSLSLETFSIPGSRVCGLLLIGHAFGAGLSTFACTVALQMVGSVTVSLITCLQSAFLFVLQYTLLKNINPGKHNAVEIIGAVLVVLGNVIGPGYELLKTILETNSDV